MKHVVGVSDMKVSADNQDTIVTYALGSCVGIAIYDPLSHVGGIVHYMLPLSSVDLKKAENNPFMFGDAAIPLLFQRAYKLGAVKDRLRVVMAGGSQVFENKDFFAIGKRNVIIARKMLWKNNILIAAEHVGGSIPRTLNLELSTGKTWVSSRGEIFDL